MPDLGGRGEKDRDGRECLPKCFPGSWVPSITTGGAGSGATRSSGASGKVMAKCALVRSLLLCDWVGAGHCEGPLVSQCCSSIF